mgnify:CR=1 FL=1
MAGLPNHFHREQTTLRQAGVDNWEQLARLSRQHLRDLAGSGQASEARLLRLRAQARLMVAAGLPPEEASLLLHAGIADAQALATAHPEQLLPRVNRLRRGLLGAQAAPIPLATVRRWIAFAAASRSAN